VGLNKSTCLHDVIISEIIPCRGEIHHLWNIPPAEAQWGLTYSPGECHTLIKPDNGEKWIVAVKYHMNQPLWMEGHTMCGKATHYLIVPTYSQ